MSVHEDHIRDRLAERLAILEDGLELIGMNYPLPNSEGSRGFIDILARDRHGVFVIVELKRSAKTSREALHEIMKYVELFQREMGIDGSEIRAFIVSTDWRELLVSFSHFKRGWHNEIRGYQLTLAQDDVTPIEAVEISPLGEGLERGITPVHLVVLGRDNNFDIDEAWRESVARLGEVGADDVLGIELHHVRRGTALYLVIGTMVSGDPRTAQLDELKDEIPDDSIEAPGGFVLEYRALCYLSWSYDYNTYEIETAYPESFVSLRRVQEWTVKRVLRAGIFAEQKILYPDRLFLTE